MKPAALIKASKDLLGDLQDEPSKYAKQAPECISQLLALVDAQANQIKKLQAALLKERFWKIWREGKHTDVKEATELARKQLRGEMLDS